MLDHKQLAFLFRTVQSTDVPDIPLGFKTKGIIHEFNARYPVDEKTVDISKSLKIYESFIHVVRIVVRKDIVEESLRDIFRSVVPKVCEVQAFSVSTQAFSNALLGDFDIPVESIEIIMPEITADDVKKIAKNIKKIDHNLSICIRAWHTLTCDHIAFIFETHGCDSCQYKIEENRINFNVR